MSHALGTYEDGVSEAKMARTQLRIFNHFVNFKKHLTIFFSGKELQTHLQKLGNILWYPIRGRVDAAYNMICRTNESEEIHHRLH